MSTKKQIASDAARALAARRKSFGGPPKKLAPCPHCNMLLGARERRQHKCAESKD